MNRRPRARLLALAMLLALPLTAGAAPKADGGGRDGTRVSGASPYAACGVGGYPEAEVEPWLAVDPRTVGTPWVNLVGVWQQDRWGDGGARGLVAGYSSTDGLTWERRPLPFDACAPGGLPYERASDPWVSIGPDGTVYVAALAVTPRGDINDSAVAVATSTDGGRTWGGPATLKADSAATRAFNDKEAITADPTRPGVAYVVWDRLEYAPDGASTGPTWFASTTDGGATWGTPRPIVAPGERGQTIGNAIVVGPDGALHTFFGWLSDDPAARGKHRIAVAHSTDGGETWSAPQVIATARSAPVTVPGARVAVRTGYSFPAATVDPATGALYATWQDGRLGDAGESAIAVARSTDGGATWTAPRRVNPPGAGPAFVPAIAVNAAGTVGVTYYDLRDRDPATAGGTIPTGYWLARSTTAATPSAARSAWPARSIWRPRRIPVSLATSSATTRG